MSKADFAKNPKKQGVVHVKDDNCPQCNGTGGEFEKKVWIGCRKCLGRGKLKKL